MLQTSLSEYSYSFAGIYPREPRNKKKASKSSTPATTFYYTKDIQYLLHEPLLDKFREHKALSKKIAGSLGRGEVGDAARRERTGAKKISLDHIIKERYPTFVDALRDLDDALSLLFLFANLPSTSTVPPKTIVLCQRLCLEFQHYLIVSHSLRKSFLSIKGIYYQATIQGQDILWLVPYRFVQRVTGDVDFRIMGTFVEFYATLLGFVNFRLYTSIGLVYPPKFNAKSDERGGELDAFTIEGKSLDLAEQGEPKAIEDGSPGNVNGVSNGEVSARNDDIQRRVDAIDLSNVAEGREQETLQTVTEAKTEAIDKFETKGADADILPQPQISDFEASSLFAPFYFFLSREAPRHPLEFILRAFGCKRIGWDAVLGDGAFTNDERDATITHQIVDRPPAPVATAPPEDLGSESSLSKTESLPNGYRVPGRTYVQPQWVWDCINEGKLLRSDLYAPGTTLPPHLSPWVKSTKGAYDPTVPLEEQEREGEAEEFAEEEAEVAELEAEEAATGSADEDEEPVSAKDVQKPSQTSVGASASESAVDDHGMKVSLTDESEEEQEGDDDGEEDFAGFDEPVEPASDGNATATDLHQLELEAEAAGLAFSEAQAAGDGRLSKGVLKTNKEGDDARKRGRIKRREEEEELQRRMGMMSSKNRKLFEKMMYGKRKGNDEAEALRRKRRKIEKAREKAK